MPKLIVQIPCYNEAETLGITAAELPREIAGFDQVEWMVIDDGSSDGTADLATELGFDHVIRLNGHQGLARAFSAGLEAALGLGADVIVNTDADNQYHAGDIPLLVAPVLAHEAEIVIGARPIGETAHFSPVKKILEKLGSAVVRIASGTTTEDAPSGFRAMSRDAAMRLHIFGDYTYTLESIIQAGQNGMRIVSVPVRTNAELRQSRLVKSTLRYVVRSTATIARIFVIYRPLVLFLPLAAILGVAGMLLGARYLYFIAQGEGAGHIQSVILAAALVATGVFVGLIGVIADLIATNRKLLERLDWKLYKIEEAMERRTGRSDDESGAQSTGAEIIDRRVWGGR
ncbi:MAG: glycosyltransferase family 2 protein [Alphaproteobacteria bacterium]|nr:glycosyltransferase family 2 protein [Alphaproteobacteria bacterium]